MIRHLPLLALLLPATAFAAGPPGPLDAVPRQTSLSGTYEENGVAVTRPSLPTQVNLYGPDGGVLWTRSANVAVSRGRFSVELGDAPALPAPLLNGSTPEVELRLGNPPVSFPRQRIHSVPYAHRSGDVIVDDRTIIVGGAGAPFPSLIEAWAWLRTKTVRGSVTLQLTNASHTLPAAGLSLDHPDGERIKILGNTAVPIVINATGQGLIVDRGTRLAQLSGVRILGTSMSGLTGLRVSGSSRLEVGPGVVIQGFDVGVEVNEHSSVILTGVQTIGTGVARGAGVAVGDGSVLSGSATTITSARLGVAVSGGAYARLDALSVSSVRDGVNVVQGGFAELTGTAQISSATVGLYASGTGTIVAPPGITLTSVAVARDPALNTSANGASWITE